MGHEQGEEENHAEIDNQRRRNPDDRYDLMDHLTALRGKQDEDGEEQPDQGPRRRPFEECLVVPGRTDELAESEPGYDGGAEGYTEEDGNAGRDGRVGNGGAGMGAADDFEEEDGEGGEENHLEDRVDGYENSAIFAVATCEAGPDEYLPWCSC